MGQPTYGTLIFVYLRNSFETNLLDVFIIKVTWPSGSAVLCISGSRFKANPCIYFLHTLGSPTCFFLHTNKTGKNVKFSLEQAMKALSWSKVYLYSFFNLSARWGWVVNDTPRPLYPEARHPVPIVQGGVGPRAVLNGYEWSLPHRDSIPGPSSFWHGSTNIKNILRCTLLLYSYFLESRHLLTVQDPPQFSFTPSANCRVRNNAQIHPTFSKFTAVPQFPFNIIFLYNIVFPKWGLSGFYDHNLWPIYHLSPECTHILFSAFSNSIITWERGGVAQSL